jgi:hypothetical protein
VCAQDIAGDRVAGYVATWGRSCACFVPHPAFPSLVDAGVSGAPPGNCQPRSGYLTRAQAELSCADDPGACRVCVDNGEAAASALAWSVLPVACACPAPQDYYCGSQTGLSEAQATLACSGLQDCHVCVQATDPSGIPQLWMAHACGCPAPYALSN